MSHRMEFGFVDGKRAELAILKAGKYVAGLSTYGATLVWFGTKDFNVVTYHPSAEGYIDDPSYMGKVVGPYANRIKDASFSLDGKTYFLEKNDNGNSLHSGSACFGNKMWEITGLSDTSVTLSLSTPEEGGFPGKHETSVTYYLDSEGILTLFYSALSSEKCPVALTNHAYFRLDDRDCRDVMLTIDAEKYVSVDELLIPVSSTPSDVEGTDFDFRSPRLIGERRAGKYDNTWCLSGGTVKAEGNLASVLIRTSEPGIQIYTGEFLSNAGYPPFYALAMEPGRYPDSPNRPDFPSSYTDRDKCYTSSTSIALTIKEA